MMRRRMRNYTPIGRRIAEMAATQEELAVALGLNRSQLSRKLSGKTALTVEELVTIANHFGVPPGLFFEKFDMDAEVLKDLYRMFLYNPIALDWVLEAFRKEHGNLVKLGDFAEKLCKEE